MGDTGLLQTKSDRYVVESLVMSLKDTSIDMGFRALQLPESDSVINV